MTTDRVSSGPSRTLPQGVVTLLFSDIEGSTRLLERLGDGYAGLLSAHRRVLHACFDAHGGHVVDTEGDAFFVAFSSPREAVAAAADGQRGLAEHRWPEGVTLRVRMGLHLGEPRLVDDHYVGMDVHRAARICSAAHGGQVVVSARLRGMLDDSELDGVAFRSLGAHRLKDIAEPEELHQLEIAGLPRTFPPLRSLRPSTNVPRPVSALVGRRAERGELRELVLRPDVRLVTVTGPGGVGKTRLVTEVALDVLDRFPHGVHFVDLSDVADEGEVLPAVARALGVPLDGEAPARETVVAYVGDRHLLLVLDNAEQVADCGLPVMELLQACPRVGVAVTSRRRLGLRDEYELALSPLSLPTGSSLPLVAESEAVQLFVDRARRARHGFDLTDEAAGPVARICALLDGLPLAIELAAARVRLFSPEALAERLVDQFELLSTRAHDVPVRHRTLRATVDWSIELLSDEERRFFQDLAVFAGGARADSVEEVTGRGSEVFDLLSGLVEHSLLGQRADADGEPRFTLLRTLRDYATELLGQDPPHEADLRERHARHFLALVEEALPPGHPPRRRGLRRVEQDHDNVHAALAHWLGRADADPDAGTKALELAVVMAQYWHRHGQAQDGTDRLERALAACPDPPPTTRAAAMRLLGEMHEQLGSHDRARALLTEAWAEYRQAGDRPGQADCLTALGMLARAVGEYGEAESLLEEAAAIRRDLGDEPGLAVASNSLRLLRLDRADPPGVADHDGRPALEAMVRFLAVADLDGVVETLEVCVGLALSRDRWVAAARLAGAARAARRRLDVLDATSGRALEARVDEARWHLGDQAFRAALREGEALTLEEATGYVLSEVLDS